MLKYILKRIGYSILVLLGVSLIMYFLVRLMPVDYIQSKIDQMNQGGATIPEETVDSMYKMYGLDREFNNKDFLGKVDGGGIKNTSFAFQEYRLFPTLSAFENAIFTNGDLNDARLCKRATKLFYDLGFSDEEMKQLMMYVEGEQDAIFEAAKKINPITAMMKS